MSPCRPVELVVFTRDLRTSDHPALSTAQTSDVVCVFVHDEALRAGPPMHPLRTRFLLECLADLGASLRQLGSGLEQRRGNWVDEVLGLASETGARSIHLSDDVSPYAQKRLARLEAAAGGRVAIRRHPGLTVVPPRVLRPAGGDHYRVFTPFYRQWLHSPRRPLLPPPAKLHAARPPWGAPRQAGSRSSTRSSTSAVGRGGEHAATERLATWALGDVSRYGRHRDDLAQPATSGLSLDLHFGCVSPLQVESAVLGRPGAEQYLRQLCWRDFYLQILAARPQAAWTNYVDRDLPARRNSAHFEAWCNGLTGVPIVDAAMRQLAREGGISNRARMIAASFLTRQLAIDWRDGARHFLAQLVDADIALNNLNWQWVAGRGTGSNPYRVLSPTRQAHRFDPDGAYVSRHVPELRHLEVPLVHEPWRLGLGELERLGYPAPIVAVDEVAA